VIPVSDGARLIRVDGPRLGHIPAFDGVRGIFVLVVVGYHAQVLDFLTGGPIVIDLFFVLSGFLITTLLLDEHNATSSISLRTFFQRRALRLFPAMYIMIAVFVVIMVAAVTFVPAAREELGPWWIEAVAAGTYSYYIVAAFMPGTLDGALGHTWSLTVEEQFYFIWPLLMMVTLRRARRRSDRNLIVGSIAFIAVMVTIRMSLQHMIIFAPPEVSFVDEGDPTWQGVLYRIASARPDMIIYGCLLALLARHLQGPRSPRFQRNLSAAAVAAWIWFFAVMLLGGRVWGFDLFGGPAYQLGLFGLGIMTLDIFFQPTSFRSKLLSGRRSRWLGQRSYGIYLWHVPVILLFVPAMLNRYGATRLAIGLVASAVAVGVGIASFRYIEMPFLKIKDTRFRRPVDVAATADRET
jgi:peptidoglycan/LPS O-acetylase OafA/YrhL